MNENSVIQVDTYKFKQIYKKIGPVKALGPSHK